MQTVLEAAYPKSKVFAISTNPKKLVIETRDSISNLDPGEWDALVGNTSPFLEHGFLATLEQTGCVGAGTGWFPSIVTARRSDEPERLLAAAPLYLKTHSRGEFVFDWGWADAASRAGIRYYPKGVVAAPLTPVTGARLLVRDDVDDPDAVRRALVSGVLEIARQAGLSSVHFNFVTEQEVDLFEELGLPVRLGVQYHWYNGRSRDEAGGYEDFDDFLARFRSKRRSNIRRERRKLSEAGVSTEVLVGDDITADHLRRMYGYYRDTVDKYYWGQRYLNEDFFVAIGEALSERLHMVVASSGGEEFAGAFNLLKNDRLYGRYWGTDEEVEFTHFEVCMYRPIAWCIEHGVEVFEPGAGGEHKYERGFEPTRTYSAHWIRDPRLAQAVGDFIADERRHIERHIEALRGESPFKSSS